MVNALLMDAATQSGYDGLTFSSSNLFTASDVECPVAEFDAFEKHYVIDSHCVLLEKNRALFALIAGVVWAFLSLRIILSA